MTRTKQRQVPKRPQTGPQVTVLKVYTYTDVVGIRLYWNPHTHEYTEENGDTFISSTDIKACFMNTVLNTLLRWSRFLKISCRLMVWLPLKEKQYRQAEKKTYNKNNFQVFREYKSSTITECLWFTKPHLSLRIFGHQHRWCKWVNQKKMEQTLLPRLFYHLYIPHKQTTTQKDAKQMQPIKINTQNQHSFRNRTLSFL